MKFWLRSTSSANASFSDPSNDLILRHLGDGIEGNGPALDDADVAGRGIGKKDSHFLEENAPGLISRKPSFVMDLEMVASLGFPPSNHGWLMQILGNQWGRSEGRIPSNRVLNPPKALRITHRRK
jgi:hypothetical protein